MTREGLSWNIEHVSPLVLGTCHGQWDVGHAVDGGGDGGCMGEHRMVFNRLGRQTWLGGRKSQFVSLCCDFATAQGWLA